MPAPVTVEVYTGSLTISSPGPQGPPGDSTATKVDPPAGPTSPGTPGQWAVDDSYRYECIDTNTWRRTAIYEW